jgi:hypothetical protein
MKQICFYNKPLKDKSMVGGETGVSLANELYRDVPWELRPTDFDRRKCFAFMQARIGEAFEEPQ